MTAACPECGAPLAQSGACIDHFHAMLLLEHEVAADPAAVSAGRGERAHFLAVSAYVLQHPDSMAYTAEALDAARRSVADVVQGAITLDALRRRVRRSADGPARITRRPGDLVVRWPVEAWPLTVVDVLDAGPDGYIACVDDWAASILATLDAAEVA
jgi:hypothetical protein